MRKTSLKKISPHTGTLKKLALSLSVAVVMWAGDVSAQILVYDQTNTTANQQGFASQLAKTIDQYTTQLKEYATQLQQYQQMLSSVTSLSNGLSLQTNQLQPVTDVASLIQGKCSDSSSAGGLVSSVMNSMSSLMTQNISQTQKMICAQIVTVQVDKYNKTVAMLNKMNGYGSQFQQLESIARAADTLADTGRTSAQVEKYTSAVTTEMANWQAEMKANDAVIATLQDQQAILGHIALKGSPTLLGTVVQATTFAAAFH
jgi:hypothetical protein